MPRNKHDAICLNTREKRRNLNLFVSCPSHGCLDHSQMDMAEVKHSEWCRKEIARAQTDLQVAAVDGKEPALRNKR